MLPPAARRKVTTTRGRGTARLLGRIVPGRRMPTAVAGLPPVGRGFALVPLALGVHPPVEV